MICPPALRDYEMGDDSLLNAMLTKCTFGYLTKTLKLRKRFVKLEKHEESLLGTKK